MEKLSSFYDFFNFLILESKTHSNTFCWLILSKMETWKISIDQNHGLTLWKNTKFSTFLTL